MKRKTPYRPGKLDNANQEMKLPYKYRTNIALSEV